MKKSRPETLFQRWRRVFARLLMPAVLGLVGSAAIAGAPRDRLTLLVPDGADVSSWQIKVWVDGAAEEGIRLDLITDSALLAMGTTSAAKIAGLVVPDSGHQKASDAVVAAIKQYAYTGGKLMLVYDAGSLTDGGFFPLTGNSRFADMVGVDYIFWNNGAGATTMVGFGPVIGTKARLDSLSIPPGKTLDYTPPASLAIPALATTAFVPTTLADPSGQTRMQALLTDRASKGIEDGSRGVRTMRPISLRTLLGLGVENTTNLRFGGRVLNASNARDYHVFDKLTRPVDDVAAVLSSGGSSAIEVTPASVAGDDASLKVISGYQYGPLSYFSYVTTGTFPGTVYLSSPEHGLVAGNRNYGSGQLLFVNIPLGSFKARGTDAMPLQGFLNLFARDQVGVASMSVQPRGKGGLIYNWHVDDGDDLNSDAKNLLNTTSFFKRGPFSIHFTAGPDVITVGDGNGMNLPGNPASQDMVRRLGNIGFYGSWLNFNKLADHELGSHGGWIHDFWGTQVKDTATDKALYTPLLSKNFDAIENVTGRKIREYSSPVGNTPLWAIQWLEARGVVAMYLVGDLGAGMVRSWRCQDITQADLCGTKRVSNKLWTAPVTPLGKWATFEEFEDNSVTDVQSGQWLLDLQSFVVNHRTNRMFYNHPPGALAHTKPINALLTRGDSLQNAGRFAWYTMAQLSDFSQRRVETGWSSSSSNGLVTFTASHPNGLDDQTWLLPKARYSYPFVTWGWGTVTSDNKNWVVTAEGGTSFKFVTQEQ